MNTLSKISIGVVVAVGLFAGTASAQLGNDNPTGTSGQFNGNVTTGCSYDPYTGNATRSITDLVIAGGVGSYPLAFTRTMNSRYTAGVPTPFGPAGNWNHSFGWSIDPVTVVKSGPGAGIGRPASYTVNYPDGRRIIFSNNDASDPNFRGAPGVRDRLQQLGAGETECYLRLPDGGRVHFHADIQTTVTGSGSNKTYTSQYAFSLTEMIDPYGQATIITRPGDGSTTITEPALRTIKIFYKQGPAGDTVIDYIVGSDGRRVEYRYLAYVTPNGTRYSTLTSVVYFNNSFWNATYTYQPDNVDVNGRPLIASCIDPMFDGPMWKIAYDFAPPASGVVSGQLLREKHPNGTPVSTMTVNAVNVRKETRGDNPTTGGNPIRTFTYNSYRLETTTDFRNAAGSQAYDANKHFYLKWVSDRKGNKTQYNCKPLNGNTQRVTYPEVPADGPTTMMIDYVYGDDTDQDPNNNSAYYLFSIKNGRSFVNKYYRDTHKRIWKIIYPDNNNEKFTYDDTNFGQKLTHTLRDDSVEKWQYGDSAHPGQVSAFFDAANTTATPTTRYVYDSFGRVWKTTDGRGSSAGDSRYTTVSEYNLRGQLTKLIHPDGTYVENYYNADGTLQWTADELGHRTEYTYDDYKRVRTVTTPVRAPGDTTPRTTITYYDDRTQCVQNGQCADNYSRTDAKPTRTISPGGKTTITSYDENLRSISVTATGDSHVQSGTTRYSYDANGNRETITDPNGNVTRMHYDKQNRLKFVDDAMVNDPGTPHQNVDGHTVSYLYDVGGNKLWERRVDNQRRFYTYTAMGKLYSMTRWQDENDPLDYIVTYDYDQLGNLKQMKDDLGHHYDYTYDGLSRKLTAEYPDDAGGTRRIESWHYDIANHLDTYTNSAGEIQTLQYDNRGRLTNAVWNTNGPAVTTAYDAASRPLNIITSNGSVVSFHYDDAGNKVWEEQSIGGQPAAQPVQPLSAVSRKTHGSAGTFDVDLPLTGTPGIECRSGGGTKDHQIVITFASPVTFSGASVTSGTGTVSSATGSGTTSVVVNLTGITNAQTITIALWNATDGANIGNVYVQVSVLLGDTTGNGFVNSADVTQTQSQSGQSVTSSNFREDVTADGYIASGDVSLVQAQSSTGLPQVGSPTHRVQTDPDADGNRTNLLVKTGATTNYALTYQYTSRNGIWQISDSTHSFTYHYGDANANISQRVGEFLQDATSFQYNPLNQPTLAAQTGLNGSALETMNYEYRAVGNLRDTYRTGSSVGDFYKYDSLNQLIEAKYSATGVSGPNPNPQNPAKKVEYTCTVVDRARAKIYDGVGNLTQDIIYGSDNLNQYTQVTVNQNPQTLNYDHNFNLTGYDGWIYAYDAQNRLILASGNQHAAAFTYDGMGRCVKRVIDGTTTVFTYDGWRPIAEWDENGALAATNLYGIGIDEILYRWSSANGELFYKSDALGNVRFLLNNSGTLVEQYTYDAFGAATIVDGDGANPRSASNFGNRFMFKGREYLSALGIYDFRKRAYHAGLGRFFQVDPKGFDGGDPHNLFRFCTHNPITGSDPMGEDDFVAGSLMILTASISGDFANLGIFGNSGALGAPIADINAVHSHPSGTVGGNSGTSTATLANMGQDQTTLPNQAGDGEQDGTSSLASRAFASIGHVGKEIAKSLLGDDYGATLFRIITFREKWVNIDTGFGYMKVPQTLAEKVKTIFAYASDSAKQNGYHEEHAGVNAAMARQLGLLGAPLIFAGGVYHEIDIYGKNFGSFGIEQRNQGTVNHIFDSLGDIAANVTGILTGLFDRGSNGIGDAMRVGNSIPGPTDFWATGQVYRGNPAEAWGPYGQPR